MLSPSIRLLIRNFSSPASKVISLQSVTLSSASPNGRRNNYGSQSEPVYKRNVEHVYTFNLLRSIIRGRALSEPSFENKNCATLNILKNVKSGSQSVEVINTLPNQLALEVSNVSDEAIFAILNELKDYVSADIIQETVKIINEEALRRMPSADPSVALAICIAMAELGVAHKSEWVWSAMKRFCRRLDKLTSYQMLQVLHLVHICRKFPPLYSSFDIQHQLVNHFDNLSLQEMAIVSIAFFKTQTKLNNKVIMSKIMRKMLEEAETCDNFSVAMLSKIIRYSMPLPLSDELYVVQSKLVQHVDQFNVQALVHLALSGTNVLVYNEPLISAILNRLRGSIGELRLKDMERLLLVMSLFNIKDDEFVKRVLKEIETRDEEIQLHPKALVSLVQYLAIMQNYNHSLIDTVLSKRFISETYGQHGKSYKKISSEIIYIDSSVAIECPEYSGIRLSAKMVTTSAKVASFSTQDTVSGTQKFSFELEDALRRIYGGNDNVAYTSILPHYHYPDFVLGFNQRMLPQAVPDDWRVHQWGTIKKPPDEKHIWMAVIVGGWNMLIRNNNLPVGALAAKLRQLRVLGYHPVIVPYTNWRLATDKDPFLKQLVGKELENVIASRRELK